MLAWCLPMWYSARNRTEQQPPLSKRVSPHVCMQPKKNTKQSEVGIASPSTYMSPAITRRTYPGRQCTRLFQAHHDLIADPPAFLPGALHLQPDRGPETRIVLAPGLARSPRARRSPRVRGPTA